MTYRVSSKKRLFRFLPLKGSFLFIFLAFYKLWFQINVSVVDNKQELHNLMSPKVCLFISFKGILLIKIDNHQCINHERNTKSALRICYLLYQLCKVGLSFMPQIENRTNKIRIFEIFWALSFSIFPNDFPKNIFIWNWVREPTLLGYISKKNRLDV